MAHQVHGPVGTDGVGDGPDARVELAQGAFDVAEEEPAHVVEPETAAALEQRRAELVLQPGDRAAERRLGDAQLLGGAAEVLQPGHGHELAQRVQIHHASRCMTA